MNTIYNRIQGLCDLAGIKPGKMCNEIGISRSILTDLKTGRKKSISLETAKKMADYFGVSVERVTGSEREKSPEIMAKYSKKVENFIAKYEKLSPEQQQLVDELVNQLHGKRDV